MTIGLKASLKRLLWHLKTRTNPRVLPLAMVAKLEKTKRFSQNQWIITPKRRF
jgi:hypothetical protein